MLNNVLVVENQKVNLVNTSELTVGEIAYIEGHKISAYNGTLVLKTFSGIVDLSNPTRTWAGDPNFKVRKIENATVTLTFGTGA